jgi:hypothetical protein
MDLEISEILQEECHRKEISLKIKKDVFVIKSYGSKALSSHSTNGVLKEFYLTLEFCRLLKRRV